jgi:SAM-dependent methyltransferase
VHRAEVAAAYDARAEEYVDRFGSVPLLAPADRATIERGGTGVRGRILDAGCGPGHWADLLSAGRDVVGVDGSAGFLASARRRFPHVPVVAGDLAALPLASASVGGVLAWYSIIHTAPAALPTVLGELARVLRPGGSLLLGFFDGEPGVPFDHAVTTAYYWSAAALAELLAAHRLVVTRSASRQDPGVRRQGELVASLSP